jgi:spore maturation protein CgeB
MIEAGYSPSVRLFEAAACGTPIISDFWRGLDELFTLEEEILVADSTADTLKTLQMDDSERRELGARARARVTMEHTAKHRASELEGYLLELSRAEVFA